ncbi:MAG: NUDIX hydrolase [Agrococcus casei]|uniref:MutT-like domain protein n=1 Tax=Agrococcus casei LMG 22410 TaxID=1255656 RepID=A0A1R4EQA4_9MICO|nr:NUDIX hydrolase [Agrococcus casei]SJM45780.1 MutT-like domain protein [Agrococcus casei LMG 22410]
MNLRPAAYCVIIEDGRMLLSHWIGGAWTLPGGGMDPGEHPEDAALREVTEETGYVAELTGLLGIDSFVVPASRRIEGQGDLQGLRIVYSAKVIGGEYEVEKDGTTDDVGWFTLDEVAGLKTSPLIPFALGRHHEAGVGTPLADRRG